MYKIEPETLNSTIDSVEGALHSLESLNNLANACLTLVNNFFALANEVPGISGSTSVSFDNALDHYNTGLHSIGSLINNLYNSHMYGTNMIGNAINTLNAEKYDIEYGYASVGGNKVHLNPNYVNGDSIVAGIAIKDKNGRVVDYYVFSQAVYDEEIGKYYYKGSHKGKKGGAYEAGIEDWLKRNYYNADGTVKEGLSMSLLLGNKTNESKTSYDIIPMAWIDSDALQIKSGAKHQFYEVKTDSNKTLEDVKDFFIGTSTTAGSALSAFKPHEKIEPKPIEEPTTENPKPGRSTADNDVDNTNTDNQPKTDTSIVGPGVSNDTGVLTSSSYTRPDGKVFDVYSVADYNCLQHAKETSLSAYDNPVIEEGVTKEQAVEILKNGGALVVYGDLIQHNEGDPFLGNVNQDSNGKGAHAVSVVQINETGDKVYVINNNGLGELGQWVSWDYLSSRPSPSVSLGRTPLGYKDYCTIYGIYEKN